MHLLCGCEFLKPETALTSGMCRETYSPKTSAANNSKGLSGTVRATGMGYKINAGESRSQSLLAGPKQRLAGLFRKPRWASPGLPGPRRASSALAMRRGGPRWCLFGAKAWRRFPVESRPSLLRSSADPFNSKSPLPLWLEEGV